MVLFHLYIYLNLHLLLLKIHLTLFTSLFHFYRNLSFYHFQLNLFYLLEEQIFKLHFPIHIKQIILINFHVNYNHNMLYMMIHLFIYLLFNQKITNLLLIFLFHFYFLFRSRIASDPFCFHSYINYKYLLNFLYNY